VSYRDCHRSTAARGAGDVISARYAVAFVRVVFALSCASLLACILTVDSAVAASVGEQKLKSAFLYNFTKFVEWPAERFVSPSDPIVIGLFATEAMLAELKQITANRQVNGRALSVLAIESAADLQAAHVIFVGAQAQARYDRLKKASLLQPALVVGDEDTCGPDGSICFVQQGDKLRFEINADTAERAQVRISAQLQKLALTVHRGS
jgi:YfiR/HmsC-like